MAVKRTNLEKDTKEYRTVSQSFLKTMPEHQALIAMVEKMTIIIYSRNTKGNC